MSILKPGDIKHQSAQGAAHSGGAQWNFGGKTPTHEVQNTTTEIHALLADLAEGKSLSPQAMERLMQIMLGGGMTPAQMAAALVALRMKGETPEEIAAAARVLRELATPFPAEAVGAIDTCGTGGDSSHSLNISTAAGFVLAGCDVPVIKHGNRSVSSRSGSADVLEALGVQVNIAPEVMAEAFRASGFAFLMAPLYHRGMRHVAPVRREMKLRTLFNVLGPLANPARVPFQLLGVYSPALLEPMAEALRQLGVTSAWVVCGEGGLDEIALHGTTEVAALKEGTVTRFTLHPQDAGIEPKPLETLRGGDATENAAALNRLLAGEISAYRDAVVLNSAACLMLTGRASNLRDAAALAAESLDSSRARTVLDTLIQQTQHADLIGVY